MNAIIAWFQDLGRPVLSDRTIRKYNKKGLLVEDPLNEAQIQPNSIDLTLAGEVTHIDTNHLLHENGQFRHIVDPRQQMTKCVDEFPIHPGLGESRKCYIIEPGEFVLMASREHLNIPNGILAFINGRSSIARMGIQTEQAGLIDAGFKGTITFEMYNQSPNPVALYEGMRVAQVYFYKAQYAIHPYGGFLESKYSGQRSPTESMIYKDREWKE